MSINQTFGIKQANRFAVRKMSSNSSYALSQILRGGLKSSQQRENITQPWEASCIRGYQGKYSPISKTLEIMMRNIIISNPMEGIIPGQLHLLASQLNPPKPLCYTLHPLNLDSQSLPTSLLRPRLLHILQFPQSEQLFLLFWRHLPCHLDNCLDNARQFPHILLTRPSPRS